jgi:hypothetical protein
MISGQHYDPNSRVLTVKFRNGAVHQYDDVGADKHDAFIGSASPGKFFNAKIKDNHLGRKLSEGK